MDNATHDKILAILGGASRDDARDRAARRVPAGDDGELCPRRAHPLLRHGGAFAEGAQHRLNDKVSLTVNLPYDRTEEILGLSMGAHAARVSDRQEIAHVGELMLGAFRKALISGPTRTDAIAIFSV